MARRHQRDEGFTEYVAGRRKALLVTAYFCCGSWTHAEDVLQTALAKLYVAWPRVRRNHSEEAYVRRIIVNATIDESRRPWRRERSADVLPDQGYEPPDHAARSDLMTALATLPPGQRRVIVLRHWLGLSVEETASDLGISTGTVKSQTAHGLAALRERLGASYTSVNSEGTT
ncbi:MAG TPA: SigE family RNA polymerase sigma factor [Nocardioidaceae bacterium]|nr:SigE family RNA polymerase sigma factor [Nocardioidaceae bacterium]